MATGAGDQYWEQRRLPSVLKHNLIRRYLPVLAGRPAPGQAAWFTLMATPAADDTKTARQHRQSSSCR